MEQLISMRQRIKAIETIKKMTHAMRLIAMSTHSKLRTKKNNLDIYKNEFERIFSKVKPLLVKPKILQDQPKQLKKTRLIILVGSQKGLLGTFNSALFKFLEGKYTFDKNDEFITIGKHATQYIKSRNIAILVKHNNFSILNFVSIAQEVSDIIFKNFSFYSEIIIFSNHPKSFFIQEPKQYSFNIKQFYKDDTEPSESLTDTPLEKADDVERTVRTETAGTQPTVEYIFEQPIEELTNTIIQFRLFIKIQDILFNSLLAEQSARFLSMDAATRNAENLLNTMRLQYNKVRQANITRELTELVTSFE